MRSGRGRRAATPPPHSGGGRSGAAAAVAPDAATSPGRRFAWRLRGRIAAPAARPPGSAATAPAPLGLAWLAAWGTLAVILTGAAGVCAAAAGAKPAAHAGAGGRAPAALRVVVSPAPGAVLTSGPARVSVTFPSPPGPGAALQVIDTRGAQRSTDPAMVRGDTWTVPVRAGAPGTYTVVWRDAGMAGASTFTVWRGGPLPPALLRAAYGGPTVGAPGPWLRLWTAVALAGAAVLLGAAAFPGGDAAARRGGLALTAGAVGTALEHTALAAGQGYPGLLWSPLFPALLGRGVALDALLAAGLGLAGAAAVPAMAHGHAGRPSGAWRTRPPLAALAAAALAMALLVATLPPVRTGPFLLGWAAACGLALWAGPLPALARRRGVRRAPLALRTAGLVGAAAAVLPRLTPAALPHGAAAVAWVASGTVSLVLGLLASWRRPLALPAAALGAAALLWATPALTRPSPLAGRPVLPPTWAYTATTGGVTLRLARLRAGGNVLQLRLPALEAVPPSPAVRLSVQRVQAPQVHRTLLALRLGRGVYAAATDALSLPGDWLVRISPQATFVVEVGGAYAGACRDFAGLTARVADLGAPVAALAVDPGDARQALAATVRGVWATADGGLHWRPAGDPGRVTSLAFGRYGAWLAATAAGLRTSDDGGVRWQPVPEAGAPAQQVEAALYPAGTPAWAVVDGRLLQRQAQSTFSGLRWAWTMVGRAPAGVNALLALPSAAAGTAAPGAAPAVAAPAGPLLAGTADGLWLSEDGGAQWQRVLSWPVSGVAAAARALWAVGPGGLYTAPGPAGPWTPVVGAVGGTQVATAGPDGGWLYVAQPGSGLWRSADGGRTWTQAGCPVGEVRLLRGAYRRDGAPFDPSAPLVYAADAVGDVAALLQP